MPKQVPVEELEAIVAALGNGPVREKSNLQTARNMKDET
jgi:hypothetical protein